MSKKILIIGATSGIGRQLALQYLEKGCKVGLTGRRKELLEQIKQQYPQQAEYECFDVTEKEVKQHLKLITDQLAGLDILVISAGTGEPSKELDWNIDRTTLATNVTGFTEIANWGFNYFVEQGYGQIVTISSIAAIRGGSWAPAYNASKAFQSSYFEGLSIKAKRMKKDIAITCIEPGFVATKMAKGNGLFWVVPVEKAGRQIMRAIDRRKRKAYISRRWWLIAKILKWAPYWLYKRVGKLPASCLLTIHKCPCMQVARRLHR